VKGLSVPVKLCGLPTDQNRGIGLGQQEDAQKVRDDGEDEHHIENRAPFKITLACKASCDRAYDRAEEACVPTKASRK
jgi:hypothetical protein